MFWPFWSGLNIEHQLLSRVTIKDELIFTCVSELFTFSRILLVLASVSCVNCSYTSQSAFLSINPYYKRTIALMTALTDSTIL